MDDLGNVENFTLGSQIMRPYLIWITAIVAYVIAVLHRSSLGVAGLEAADQFQTGAAILALFTVVQLAVYAGAQIPVGILLDRWGSRRLIALGAIAMALGQLAMALSETPGQAIAARILIGGGDAMTFTSVIRLIPSWFPQRRVPLFTQLTGICGQLGQVLSALPFVWLLHAYGWRNAFITVAIAGGIAGVLVWAFVRDTPNGQVSRTVATGGVPLKTAVGEAIVSPGAWLGFFTHMITSFALNVFVLLWGYPFLIQGQGLSEGQASTLLTWNVLVAIVAGPIFGELTARHPLRRSWLVLAIAGIGLFGWLLVLVPNTPRPLWVLFIFVTCIAIGGPGSMIGFDFVRTTNPAYRLGAATGVANMGGFLGGLIGVLGVGVILDHVKSGEEFTLGNFRVAFSFLAVLWIIALIGLLRFRMQTRKLMLARGEEIPQVRHIIKKRLVMKKQ